MLPLRSSQFGKRFLNESFSLKVLRTENSQKEMDRANKHFNIFSKFKNGGALMVDALTSSVQLLSIVFSRNV